ncbi:MAG: polysaccharide biosynthesis protein [Fimbriimonadaceae bacterium]|nr:polysaccharide biosynthesis protein [Alphaproteobacteria bacterium]
MLNYIRGATTDLHRSTKLAILIVFDFLALTFAVWAAYSIRLNTFFVPDLLQVLVMIAAPLTAIPVFVKFGLYRAVIRYLPERAFWTIANAVIFATLLWVGLLFALEISRYGFVPRSVPVIYFVLAFLILSGSRFGAKYFLWTPLRKKMSGDVAIYGAGAAGFQLASALQREGNKYVAGFIDDDKSLQGRDVAGIRVYSPEKLAYLIDMIGVKEIILSMPSINAVRRQEIIANLSQHQVKIRALPGITDLASGRYLISQIREIDIDDILGRSLVPANPALLEKMIKDRAILVTGAGGSIGSELCRLIAKWKPAKLVLLEANEFALYQIGRELKKRAKLPIVSLLGSVTEAKLVSRTIKDEDIQVVFHAAAHKHVPLVEANVLEGIRNNVFGTNTIAKTAYEAGVENFVLISTDKAVRPTNVMGATKRWAELVVHHYADKAQKTKKKQKFCTVRFGNVLGSNGSVVPLFKEQIVNGGPVTVTDKEMTRYFMSIHEASELIVQAGALCEGGDTFLLEMGEPVHILDLAKNMIQLAGLGIRSEQNPSGEIAISIIGRRPGEKTHEELYYDPSSAKPTSHPKILRTAQTEYSSHNIETELAKLAAHFEKEDETAARQTLFDLIFSQSDMENQPQISSEDADQYRFQDVQP